MKITLALVLAACALGACTTHRTVVERPVVLERDSAPRSTVVVPPGSDVTIED
jgi:hypothetical protein